MEGQGEKERKGVGCTQRKDPNSTAKFLKMEMALESQPTEGMWDFGLKLAQLAAKTEKSTLSEDCNRTQHLTEQ